MKPTRLVTPTGVLVLPASAGRDQWLKARRERICSSDVAAIVGVSPHGTALRVWYDKNGLMPEQDQSEPMLWGSLHEETIAREWARRNKAVIQRVGLIQRANDVWMGATLDRAVRECPLDAGRTLRCFLECKHRDKMTTSRWTAGCPDDVHAQVAWALAVTGFEHAHVAVLLGGNDYRQFTIRRDPQLGTDLIRAAAKFRETLSSFDEAQARLTYGTDPDEQVAIDNQLHPDRSGLVELAGSNAIQAHNMLVSYQEALAEANNAEQRKKAAKAALVGLLGASTGAKIDNNLYYTYEPVTRRSTDLEKLLEHYPAAYRDCVTATRSPSLQLKAPAKSLVQEVNQ